jgi:hypothetical protein
VEKTLLSAISKVSSGSLRFVLDSVGKLHGLPYFSSSKTGNYNMSALEATNFKFSPIYMTLNFK